MKEFILCYAGEAADGELVKFNFRLSLRGPEGEIGGREDYRNSEKNYYSTRQYIFRFLARKTLGAATASRTRATHGRRVATEARGPPRRFGIFKYRTLRADIEALSAIDIYKKIAPRAPRGDTRGLMYGRTPLLVHG
ncbi:hypothetical protein EVAR_86007_1 [Eumeta japonica]|uniref:Uncharacterized protein n=1 Tax=Eumeta variegata TaxID=151549 RepID=A0A4C1UJB2_EUMVA|nr:hypothetical protein EVAR_86007_1 [Eumeta japonica]